MADLFGSKPNIKNTIYFFNNSIIKQLWWGDDEKGTQGFIHSDKLQRQLSKLDGHKRKQIIKMY